MKTCSLLFLKKINQAIMLRIYLLHLSIYLDTRVTLFKYNIMHLECVFGKMAATHLIFIKPGTCRPQRLVSCNHFHSRKYACVCVYTPKAINN